MPSDAKKREQQRKKDAAKARQGGKKPNNPKQDEELANNKQMNGTGDENGSIELSAEGRNSRNFVCITYIDVPMGYRGFMSEIRSRCSIKRGSESVYWIVDCSP